MLDNQVVEITGAAGRIGTAFAKSIVENGGKVLLGDILAEQGQKLAKSLGVENALFISEDPNPLTP